MITAILQWLNTNGQAVQGLALIATLLILVWQSRQLSRQVELSNIANSSTHFKDLNMFIMQNPRAFDLAEEAYPDLFAALIIGTLETRYHLWKAGFVPHKPWKGDKQTMKDTFGLAFVLAAWERLRPEYDPRFVRFIDKEILPYRTQRPPRAREDSATTTTTGGGTASSN